MTWDKVAGLMFWGIVVMAGCAFLAVTWFPYVLGIFQQLPDVLARAMR